MRIRIRSIELESVRVVFYLRPVVCVRERVQVSKSTSAIMREMTSALMGECE